WINSQLLAQNSPAGYFTGLAIRKGSVTLGAQPQMIGDKLSVSAGTKVSVKLELRQPPAGADPGGPYGEDARDAQIELPAALDLHFTGQVGKIDGVGRASWNVFGHAATFTWAPQQAATYDALLHRVLIPFTASTETFRVTNNQSTFHTLAGEA